MVLRSKYFFGIIAVIMFFIGSGCNMDYRSKDDEGSSEDTSSKLNAIQYLKSSDIDVRSELITAKDNDNVLTLSNGEHKYSYYKFTKRGSSSSDEADSSGTNAAILAKEEAIFTLYDSLVFSSGDHAHGIFSLGDGTNATVSDCVVSVNGRNSSGLITSSSGIITAKHVTAETFGASSPALYVRDGGGTITAERGKYTTSGANSPVIRSEGEIEMSNAKLEAGASQAVVLEGKSSVILTSCDLTSGSGAGSAVMIYMEASGNSASNAGAFSMTNGKITCISGDIFHVTNATANISLHNAELVNNDENGAFLRAEASQWGTSGVNGGKITLTAENQDIDGDIYLDGISDMNMYLTEDSYFTGSINPSSTDARIFVCVKGSKWILTEDSHIESLTCEENSITLNGNNLYIAGKVYAEGTESSGSEIDFSSVSRQDSAQDEAQGDDDSTEDTDNTEDSDNTGDTETPEDSGEAESEDKRLSFDALIYTTGTVNGVSYRAYNDIVYVSKPVVSDCQKLSVYIPEPYFSSRPVNGYTASTAPIFVPNNSAGYMAASIMTPQSNNPVGLALSRGLVVVSPALRGRNVSDGTAPAAIVDYKAAIRYIRANKGRLPAGNTDRIISCGVSSGGALSALLGTSGNSSDYDYWLEEIGAADGTDDIFASVCYCPITNLENADSAYEWVFGGEKYGEASSFLHDDFESYFNLLGLTKNGVNLEAYDYDEEYEEGQTFRRYMNGLYAEAAQKAIDSGTVISADWVKVSGDKVISADMKGYAASFITREKGIPAFDKLDLSSAENSLFDYKHFTTYSSEHSTAGGALVSQEIITAMNPMEYIDNADNARFWRIRHGVNDRDITLTIPAILALRLENAGLAVNFEAVWGQGHNGYYDTGDLFDWIDSICK